MRTSSERPASAVLLALFFSALTYHVSAAPLQDEAGTSDVDYVTDEAGCYYNFQHYAEGDRIVTNEPCLNCTCHNRMLMCYLRVCPFTKAIGQDCTVEKHPDQCCPIISCPEVPVKLLTSTTEQPTTTTAIGAHDNYGCTIRNSFFADGVQVPSDPRKPCELCYCIRNRTACVMQECTLHVEGCRPVYQAGVCCPVRYECDHEDKDSSAASYPFNGTSVLTTAGPNLDCKYGDDVFADGESIATDKPCEHCYCMRGDIVCAVQDCGEPLRGKDCTPLPVPPGQCCPASYTCANETVSYQDPDQSNDIITQVQGIINSIKDDTRPDMLESTADIINPEEVIAPDVIPSDDTDIENHEASYVSQSNTGMQEVSPGALHDHTEVEAIHDSETPSAEGDILKPEQPASVPVRDQVSETYPTSKPINELDSTISDSSINNIEPQVDDSKVSNTPIAFETSSSSYFEATQSSTSEVFGDNVHEVTEKDSSTKPEVASPEPVLAADVTNSPDKDSDPTSSEGTAINLSEINPDDASIADQIHTTAGASIVNSDTNIPSSEQTNLNLNATESTSNGAIPEKQVESANEDSMPEKPVEPVIKDILPESQTEKPIKDAAPEKQPENEVASILDASNSPASSPIKPGDAVHDSASSEVPESNAQQLGEKGSSGNDLETNPTNPAAQDKIDTPSSSIKTPSAGNTQIPNEIHHDDVHQDFSNHDDEDLADLKPNEVVDNEEVLHDINIAGSESNRIPGEGDCLIDGNTYTNTSVIPTSNPCHVKCECISSIPSCTMVSCPPPPPQHQKCEPIQPESNTCCPTYACAAEHSTAGLEAQNQIISDSQPLPGAADHSDAPYAPESTSSTSIQEENGSNQQFVSPSNSETAGTADNIGHKDSLEPVKSSEYDKTPEVSSVINNYVNQDATHYTTKEPEYIQTTFIENTETTLQPHIQAAADPVSSDTAPNPPNANDANVVSNINEDENPIVSTNVAESHKQNFTSENASPAQTVSDGSPSSQNLEMETNPPQESTAADVEVVTTAGELEPAGYTETPVKVDGVHESSDQSQTTPHNEANVVSPSVTPEIGHNDSDNSSDGTLGDEKEPEVGHAGNDQPPSFDNQQPSESVTIYPDSPSTEVSESVSLPEKDTVSAQDTPNKDSETYEQQSPVTTAAAEIQPEIVTELQSGDVYSPEIPVGTFSDGSQNESDGEHVEKETEAPTVQDDDQPPVSIQTASVQPSDVAAPVSPTKHENIEVNTEIIEDLSPSVVTPSKDTIETVSEGVYVTTLSDNLSISNVQGQTEVSSDSGTMQFDSNQSATISSHPSTPEFETNEGIEGSTEAELTGEIIFHDNEENKVKPESDSSIYVPSKTPESGNGILGTNTLPQSNSQGGDKIQSVSIADSPSSHTSVTHFPSSDISQDQSAADGNAVASDSSNLPTASHSHDESYTSNEQVMHEGTQPAEPTVVPDQPSNAVTEAQLDSQSTNSGSSQTNEQENSDSMNLGSPDNNLRPVEFDPTKSSTETNYYDTGSEIEYTVAPMGVPGENLDSINIKPVQPQPQQEFSKDELTTVVYDHLADHEMNPSSKPEDPHQESYDEVIAQSPQTDSPISIPETTFISIVEDIPSAIGTEQNNGPPLNFVPSVSENHQEAYDQTTISGTVDSEKLPEANQELQTPLSGSPEAHENEPPSEASATPDSTQLSPELINNVPATLEGDPPKTGDEQLPVYTEAPSDSTNIHISSINNELKPDLPESDSLIHNSPINSESLGSEVDSTISQSTEKASSQDSIPSLSQGSDNAEFSGASEPSSDSSNSVTPGNHVEILPEHGVQNPEAQPSTDEIKDSSMPVEVPSQTVIEVTNNEWVPIDSHSNQEPLNVISSQNNVNTQTESDKTEEAVQPVSEPSLNVDHAPVESADTELSPNAESQSLEPSNLSPTLDTETSSQDKLEVSPENPVTSPILSSNDGSNINKSNVSSLQSNFIPSIQTESPPALGSESISPEGQAEILDETLRPSEPVAPDGVVSQSSTNRPVYMPSETDLLTSIIQGHLGDQNKPVSGFGSDINSQLSDLLNKVSTPVPISPTSSSTAHDTILQSSWTPKPMPPQPEESSHRPGEEESLPTDSEYEEDEEGSFGPGTCKYLGKLYVSAQQIPRDDPCDFCFCFRSDIICLQQSCPPPIFGCRQESIQGFCCPRYECPVSKALSFNSSTTSTSTTTLPPLFHSLSPHGENVVRSGCALRNRAYRVGEVIKEASDPCRGCLCGADGQMKCEPRYCSPEPILRKFMEQVASRKR